MATDNDMIALQEDFAEFQAVVREAIEETREQLSSLTLSYQRAETVLFGNPDIDHKGLTDRVKAIEKATAEMIAAEKSRKDKLLGIQIGLGITSVLSGVSAYIQLWGG